jgi:hypothetical protein
MSGRKNLARQSEIASRCKYWSCDISVRTLSGHVAGQGGQKVASGALVRFVSCFMETCYVVEIAIESVFCPLSG